MEKVSSCKTTARNLNNKTLSYRADRQVHKAKIVKTKLEQSRIGIREETEPGALIKPVGVEKLNVSIGVR